MSKLADFLSELKRRRVYRVAVVYAGVAFIISEIVANTIGYLHLPDSFGTAVIVILIIGFPIVIGLAWAFDITDEGIVRAKWRPADAKRKAQPLLGNKSLAVIAVLAIIVAVWALLRGPSLGGGAIRSIAVLPLDNIGGDPENVDIVEGMHDNLISEMSKIGALVVRGRQSTLQYESSDKTIPEIASELDVDALIEGSIQLEGERVRVIAQLVDSRDRHLWSNDYERDFKDVFALYDDVIRAIVQEIRVALTPEEEANLASAPQVDPEALELYYRGWQQRLIETSESMLRAVEYLEQAVAIDSTFADAWAALAASCMTSALWTRGFEALDKALELDPDNVVALTWQGLTQYYGMREGAIRNYAGAKAYFHRALELDPGNVFARYEYGQFLYRFGQPHEALAEFRLAQDLDPVSSLPPRGFAWVYNSIRQYDKALEYARLRDELRNVTATDYSGIERQILMQQGRYEEAAAWAEEVGDVWDQLRAEWALGNREKVYAIRDSLVSIGQWSQQEQDNPMNYARFYSLIGEKDKALDLLELAFENVNQAAFNLTYNPEWDSLRAEPRHIALRQRNAINFQFYEWTELFDENGNLIHPIDETLEAYNAPGSR